MHGFEFIAAMVFGMAVAFYQATRVSHGVVRCFFIFLVFCFLTLALAEYFVFH